MGDELGPQDRSSPSQSSDSRPSGPESFRPQSIEVVETRDGSRTLYDRERDVHYSSLHGAKDESRHIFVEGTGIAERSGSWRVLELGFGAGINFIETCRRFLDENPSGSLVYHSVDYAPVTASDVPFHDGALGKLVRDVLGRADARKRNTVEQTARDGRIRLHLHPIDWCSLALEEFRADAIYYDPFGPKDEPNSWTPECFRVARRHIRDEGVLGTYSAASDVKRAMFRAGFFVASAPGPGPKREITFASPDEKTLERWELLDRGRYLDGADA